MILCDRHIRERCLDDDGEIREDAMIEPFSEAVSGGNVISSGLTSSGYDLRLGQEFLVFKNTSGEPVDPKRFKDPDYSGKMFDHIVLVGDQKFYLQAGGYVLARSLEYLRCPSDLKGRVVGKSTMARCGILINCTPIEPGWQGHLTIEISNLNNTVAILHPGEGIAQLEFDQLSGVPERDYASKQGIYQGQKGVTPARTRA